MDQTLRRDAELRAVNNYGGASPQQHDRSTPLLTPPPHCLGVVSQPHPQFYSSPPPMAHHSSIHGKSSLSYNYNHSLPQESHSTTPNSHELHARQQQQQQQSPNDSTTTTTDDIATKARQEWQQYGKNKTQILEDLRYGRY